MTNAPGNAREEAFLKLLNTGGNGDEDKVEFVDLRFTDTKGKLHHMTQHASTITEDVFEDGIMFDGSSIQGWKAIHESDMVLKLDVETAVLDPFTALPSLIVFCDVLDPSTGRPYNRDPRSTARRAATYMQSLGIADTAYFGPEAEFFMFDDVRYKVTSSGSFYKLGSDENPEQSGDAVEGGNHGHRPREKGGYFPVPPVDSGTDIRAEMVKMLNSMGLQMEKHHHEVAPAQHELGMKYDTLLKMADGMQLYKYGVHMVAHSYGKTATFMPKPVLGDNGSGMHVHQSLWKKKDGKNLFAGNQYADLSEMCLYYIGGILKHARALNAFTNPTINSYKRLVPGYEAPVLLAYSARNRSASCRIPYASSASAKRIEIRFPDPAANPYLAFAAMLMAGLDGIENRIHPGEPMDKDLYDLPPLEQKNIPRTARNLDEALEGLDTDRAFLKRGDVMDDDQIDAYIELKRAELEAYDLAPHPIEYKMYYSV